MKLKKALILSKASLHNGPRYIREFEILKDDFKIYALGISQPNNNFVEYIDFYKDIRNNVLDKVVDKIRIIFGMSNEFRFSYCVRRKLKKTIKQINPSIVIIHTPIFIPYIFENFKNRPFKVAFNAHEYHPLEFEDNENWMNTYGKYFYNIYAKYLQKLDLMINVCDGIANRCKTEFNMDSIVMPNAALYNNIEPIFNQDLPIRVIHHGACIRSRNIEVMIEILGQFPEKYRFDLMLTKNDTEYYNQLVELANEFKNIRFIAPVSFNEIVPFINSYDIGFYIIPPNNFNNYYSLPNKFFEFIQSKLALVIGPSFEMKKIVDKEKIGVVARDFNRSSYHEIFERLSLAQVNNYKNITNSVARTYCSESYESKLKEKIDQLVK